MKKQILAIAIALVSIAFQSCGTDYIRVETVKDGEFILVKDFHNLTRVNDTLVISNSKPFKSYNLHGKYKGSLPVDSTKTFKQVIRIR